MLFISFRYNTPALSYIVTFLKEINLISSIFAISMLCNELSILSLLDKIMQTTMHLDL